MSCLEGYEHRFCLRHLYANFKKKFGGGVVIRDLMMGAAKATYRQLWEKKMNELRAQNQAAWEYLIAIPTRSWCKHDFSFYPKCDVLLNNLSESFNATILLARDKPILTMMDWIRTYLMGRFATLREKFQKYRGEVMPKPMKRLSVEIEKSAYWFPTCSSEDKFEVKFMGTNGDSFIVDLRAQSCTCNLWELVGIPCRHVVACISYNGLNPQSFVHDYYKRAAYEATYGHEISPINGQTMWEPTNDPDILPPLFKRRPGRPKKLRRRDPYEDTEQTHLHRGVARHRCSRCGQHGHNTRRCTLPPPVNEEGENSQAQNESQVINETQTQTETQAQNQVPTVSIIQL